ncbi:MAG: bifunctional biotin--[acetyl-CoA-carboxylase] ligase/biotin operon repressor BirA [Oceanicoccus sp.]
MFKTLLSTLSDGQFHSGDVLGDQFGVSRTAIWKQLKKVEDLGIPLESVKGKGYRIPGGLDLIDGGVIRESLLPQVSELVSGLDVRDVVDSTNVIALNQAMAGACGYVCTAEQQTAGKGRRGKAWASPYASNLYMSVVWEFVEGAAALEGLSLAVGVAVVEALNRAGVNGVQLKWPNDVLCQGRKLAGILLEVAGDLAGPCRVVVGIGLNVNMPSAADIDQPWIDIKEINRDAANRNQLLALILNELIPLLSDFERQGFSSYRDRWLALDAYAGREVAMLLGDESVIGRAVGVDKSGAVLVETSSGVRTFSGGEVSLRARS